MEGQWNNYANQRPLEPEIISEGQPNHYANLGPQKPEDDDEHVYEVINVRKDNLCIIRTIPIVISVLTFCVSISSLAYICIPFLGNQPAVIKGDVDRAFILNRHIPQPHPTPTPGQLSLVSLHLRLLPPHVLQDTAHSSDHLLMRFDVTGPLRPQDHVRGVNVTSDTLVIRHSGLYYIYASINFTPTSPDVTPAIKNQKWNQQVHIRRPHSPANTGVVFETVHTPPPTRGPTQESVYNGAIINVLAGDEIQLCISAEGISDFSPESSFIGLFMLKSKDV